MDRASLIPRYNVLSELPIYLDKPVIKNSLCTVEGILGLLSCGEGQQSTARIALKIYLKTKYDYSYLTFV